MVIYEKDREKVCAHQFLMELENSCFGTTRSNLLSRGTDMNLETIYSQIIREEHHLSAMRSTDDLIPVTGFSAASSSPISTCN